MPLLLRHRAKPALGSKPSLTSREHGDVGVTAKRRGHGRFKKGMPKLHQQQHLRTQQQQRRQQQEHKALATEEPADAVAPVVVPAAKSLALPAVGALLSNSRATLSSIAAQMSALEKTAAKEQSSNEARLADLRKHFEQQLREQEARNLELEQANSKIELEAAALEKGNEDLAKSAAELRAALGGMQQEMHALQGKLGQALDFAAAHSADPQAHGGNATVMKVEPGVAADASGKSGQQIGGVAKPTRTTSGSSSSGGSSGSGASSLPASVKAVDGDAQDQEDTSEAQGADGFALLAVRAQVRRGDLQAADNTSTAVPASPAALLAALSSSVMRLRNAESQSSTELEMNFNSSRQAGQVRRQALEQRRAMLIARRRRAQDNRAELKGKVRQLEKSRDELAQHVRNLGLFLQRLAHFALAPAPEAHRLLGQLPEDVAQAAPPPSTSKHQDFASY